MKKLHIFIVGLLASFVFINFSGVNVFAQSVAPGAAKLNDLQSQASGSYQSNGLNQDVGNVSTGGASGAANLLRGDSQQSGLVVVGAPVNNASANSTSKLSTGWIIFGSVLLFVLIAPLIVIYKKSVDAKLNNNADNKPKPKKETIVKDVNKSEVVAAPKDEAKKEEKPVKSKGKSKKSKNVNKAKRGKKKKK